jgi:hypothetical protein
MFPAQCAPHGRNPDAQPYENATHRPRDGAAALPRRAAHLHLRLVPPQHPPPPTRCWRTRESCASIYGGTDEMQWAVDWGIHPSTDEIGRIIEERERLLEGLNGKTYRLLAAAGLLDASPDASPTI